ncbi:MAG: endonuclease III [bacterium]|nr:endonuclease III [bacterium]
MIKKKNYHPKILLLHNRLAQEYGKPRWQPGYDPLTELIFTVLSQHTSDSNRDIAFARLRKKFPNWELVRDAPKQEVAEAIRTAGLWKIKSARIQSLLRMITERFGKLSLDFLAKLDTNQAKEILLSLDGVGLKTAACVLLFSLHRPLFPVDTHIFRITKRVGLIPQKATPDDAHQILQESVPGKIMYPFHINLIRHGRLICKAERPECNQCCIYDQCKYYSKSKLNN